MERTVVRKLPDGSVRRVQPFHVSLEGLEKAIICRDREDYDAVEKQLVICAKRKNVLIIIHTVVSNHAHVAVLAAQLQSAQAYADEVKRMIGMWVRRKYGDAKLMKKVDASVEGGRRVDSLTKRSRAAYSAAKGKPARRLLKRAAISALHRFPVEPSWERSSWPWKWNRPSCTAWPTCR